jgi:hypothetical protein
MQPKPPRAAKPEENLTMKKIVFPTDDSVSAAIGRAETILDLYSKAQPTTAWGGWQEMVTQAIADLAILSHIECGIACAEAQADGDQYCGGHSADSACEYGAELAEEMLEEQRQSDLRGLYEEGGVA